MYNETYEEYIRSILGYPTNNSQNNYNTYENVNTSYQGLANNELEESYPEIYKIVYPMIKNKCNNFMGSINKEEIENMTDEIYYALDNNESVKVNMKNETKAENMANIRKETEKKYETRTSEKVGEKREARQINRNLRDLIKILLIRELLNRPGRPGRPPMPPPMSYPPMRPPFRPGPGRNIFNRDIEMNSHDIFEY